MSLLDIELTDQQTEYLPAINWLLSQEDKDHQTGRTLTMAYIFIYQALANPNTWIYVYDHFPTLQAKSNLIQTIYGLVNSSKLLKKLITIQADRILCKKDEIDGIFGPSTS